MYLTTFTRALRTMSIIVVTRSAVSFRLSIVDQTLRDYFFLEMKKGLTWFPLTQPLLLPLVTSQKSVLLIDSPAKEYELNPGCFQ